MIFIQDAKVDWFIIKFGAPYILGAVLVQRIIIMVHVKVMNGAII